MKFPIVVLVSGILCLAALGPVIAQEAEPAQLFTLEDCLEIAMDNQVDLQIAENNLIAAQARSTQAKAGYLPRISIQNNAFNIGSNGVLTQTRTGTAVTVTENVFDGGLREARTAGARHGVTQSHAGLERTVQAVVFDVTRAYYEALRAKHLADVAAADVEYNEELMEMVRARAEVGAAAEVDVLPVEAQLANSRVSLLSARNAVRTSLLRLQNAMGLAPRPGFDVREVAQEPNPELLPLETYLSAALAERPDVLQAQAAVGAAGASVRSTRIALYPRPQITAEYQRGVSGLSGESSQIIGGIAFDIFSGGSNRAAHREAQANQSTARQRQDQLARDIQAQVEEVYLNMNNASERLAASRTGLEAAERNYDVQQARYMQGLAIPLDLLNAELQVVSARTNLVNARYDLYTAMAQMDFAVGKDGGFNAG